jgi:hypothetical protein
MANLVAMMAATRAVGNINIIVGGVAIGDYFYNTCFIIVALGI